MNNKYNTKEVAFDYIVCKHWLSTLMSQTKLTKEVMKCFVQQAKKILYKMRPIISSIANQLPLIISIFFQLCVKAEEMKKRD